MQSRKLAKCSLFPYEKERRHLFPPREPALPKSSICYIHLYTYRFHLQSWHRPWLQSGFGVPTALGDVFPPGSHRPSTADCEERYFTQTVSSIRCAHFSLLWCPPNCCAAFIPSCEQRWVQRLISCRDGSDHQCASAEKDIARS